MNVPATCPPHLPKADPSTLWVPEFGTYVVKVPKVNLSFQGDPTVCIPPLKQSIRHSQSTINGHAAPNDILE